MKTKNFIIISSLAVVLTACTGKPPPFEERVAAPPDTLVGVIEPLDQIDIYREGTHGLRTETGELILIQSSTINLNRYLEKAVTLKGESGVSLRSERPVFTVSEVVFQGEGEEEESETDEEKAPEKDPSCPFIAPPDCSEYKPAALGKNDCPTRFVCIDEEQKGEGDSTDLGRVMDTITRHKKELLETSMAKVIQFEASPEASLIAVVYEKEEKKTKKLFEYSPSGPEFNFSEKAIFRFDLGRWVVVSGEDLQKDKAIKTIYVGQ